MKLDDCGCCEKEAPTGVANDPGLSEITVRIADFGGFKRGMHDALGRQDALAKLTTRDDADPALALIDAWATALDVLTFYNDRIANESYLRTATDPRSMREFAREIGYVPAPATAALADLAFTVKGVESVRIDAGTKVQSQPGQDELPQVFETLETIVAYPAYNAIPVRRFEPDRLTLGRTAADFVGTALNVKVGDTLLVVSGTTAMALVSVVAARTDDARGTTRLEWSPSLPSEVTGGADAPQAFVVRQKAAAFGYNAVAVQILGGTLTEAQWAGAPLAGSCLDLDAIYPSIAIGSWLVLKNDANATLLKVATVSEAVVNRWLVSGKVTRVGLDGDIPAGYTARDALVLTGTQALELADRKIDAPLGQSELPLEGGLTLDKGRSALVVGKRVRIAFDGPVLLKGGDGQTLATIDPGESVRVENNVLNGPVAIPYEVTLDDGTRGWIDALSHHGLFLPPREDDPADLSERVVVGEDGLLAAPLRFMYDRDSTVVHANVAAASHGETKREIVGSGNAARSFQKFALAHAPLTYLPADTETGSASTLGVRVENVLWHETLTLLDQGPRDRSYTVRPNEAGKTELTFGNGAEGARLPTGAENVAATYRVGAGLAGRVRRGTLNMLLTRPLGVTEVINPGAATGGSDAEGPDDVAKNVPRSVLTLGRIVSLSDFADAAARLPGVAKAQSALLWRGDGRVVFVTVAGPDGSPVDVAAVARSLDAQRDVRQSVVVMQAEARRFRTRIEIVVREDHLAETVLAEVREVLIDAFGFERREFGEAVTTSEIAAAVHEVAGVRGANVTVLDFTGAARNDALRIEAARWTDGAFRPAEILTLDPARIELTEIPSDV